VTGARPPRIVTIVGSDDPSEYLATGERMTVQLTAHVQDLIDRGAVIIVEHPDRVQQLIEQGIAVDASPDTGAKIEEGNSE
jgi:hypothetical protein